MNEEKVSGKKKKAVSSTSIVDNLLKARPAKKLIIDVDTNKHILSGETTPSDVPEKKPISNIIKPLIAKPEPTVIPTFSVDVSKKKKTQPSNPESLSKLHAVAMLDTGIAKDQLIVNPDEVRLGDFRSSKEVHTTAKHQLIVHPEGVRLGDFRSSIGVYDKSAPHGTWRY